MSNNLPTFSIITPTLNSAAYLKKYFSYLDKQNYPRTKIEIIISDGGSTDETLVLAKKHHARILHNKRVLAEPGADLGVKNARHELLVFLAADNYLVDPNFFQHMALAFTNKHDQVAAAIADIRSFPHDNFLNKYINRFTDPFSHFIYSDASCLRDYGKVYAVIAQNSDYIIYDFNSVATKPILALAQGMTLRKELFVRDQADEFDDIASIYKLIQQKKHIAYVLSTFIVHDTIKSITQFLRKTEWATFNALNKVNYGFHHRQESLTLWQKIKLKIWPLYSLSFIFPLFVTLSKIITAHELIWIYHPVMCWLSGFASARAVLKYMLFRQKEITRYKNNSQ